MRPSDRPCFTWSIIDCWRLALTFSDLSGEFFIAFGVNYPLKVAAFGPTLPGCFYPAAAGGFEASQSS
jgi:hypothetical protein